MSNAIRLDRRAVRSRVVRVGDLAIGDGMPVAVIGGHDARGLILRDHDGETPADEVIRRARADWAGPLLVEPSSAADLDPIARHADGVVVGAARMRDLALVRAVARLGLPVVLQRGRGATVEEWLAAADHCAAGCDDRVVLCEGGGRTHPGAAPPDLALMRAARVRSGRPVIAAIGEATSPGEGDGGALAAAAVAAGADGLLLAPAAAPAAVAAAHEAATVLAPLVRPEEPATLAEARAAIDRVDAALATLLERRVALARTVQRLKPVGGFRGRDPERERRLVAAMARRAPLLGEERLAPVMNAVIEAGLRLAEEECRGARIPSHGSPDPA